MTATIDARPLRTIGPYEVLYEIGRGGMGIVYCAQRSDGGPRVALKIPSEEMADYFGCMRREIQALSRLRHPGVVRIIEEGAEAGVPWYAMELLDARSLDDLLDITDPGPVQTPAERVQPFEPRSGVLTVPISLRGRPHVRGDLPRALTLMYRLARVLAYVHSHGIVHRDLKPYNVLVRAGDRPVLVDFGLMGRFRAQSGREVLEIGGLMVGTAMYSAPEQITGELVDARADLYSFGAMLYEIVAGAPPFSGTSPRDVMMMHLTMEPVAPSVLVQGVPPVLEALILQLLQKSRGDRLGYAEDVAALLVEAGAEPDPDFGIETASYLYRSAMIGRQDTIASLRTRIPALRKGEGSFVTLSGVSGIGKTSVAAAFAREATLASIQVVTGECIPVATTGDAVAAQALHPFRPLLRAIADHCISGGEETIERVLGPRLPVLREQEPALGTLADRRGAPRLAPEVASRRLYGDLAETLRLFAGERPLLLIIDDLQWADEVTLRFLGSLGPEFFHDLPLLILGTYRADEVSPGLREMLARPHLEKVHLGRVDDESVADIVRSMLAAPGAPAGFLHFLARQSEGNPFFVAEYLRAAVVEGLLYRERGRWCVGGEEKQGYGALGLPGTLRDLVARRLEMLSPLAQRVAETAAVLGREVSESLLIETCGESDAGAGEAITELLDHYVFDPVDAGVRFAHDKLREAAYERLPDERRRVLHARAAETLERQYASVESLRAHAAELAHHCDLAGMDEKAIRYYTWAGERAFGNGAFRETVDLIQRAITVRERSSGAVATTPEERLERAAWHRLQCSASFGLGDPQQSFAQGRKALAAVGVHLPQDKTGWRFRLAREIARQAVHIALPRRFYRARGMQVPVLVEVARSGEKFAGRALFANDAVGLLASGLIAVNAADCLDPAPGIGRGYSSLAIGLSTLGVHRLADRYLAECRRISMAVNDIDSVGHAAYASLSHAIGTCDWARCRTLMEEWAALARVIGDHAVTQNMESIRAHYELYTGRLEQSLATYTRLLDVARRRSNAQHESWGHFGRASVFLLMGRVDEALQAIRTSRSILAGQRVQLDVVVIESLYAQVLLWAGDLRGAAEAADTTYAMASGTTPLMMEMYRAFAAPTQVYLEVWGDARHRDALEAERMRRAVDGLLRTLRRFSRRVPMTAPLALRYEGIAECLKGNMRRGERLLRSSIATAARLGLPLEEGIGEYELVRHTILDPRERALHRERARTIFRETGCELYLQKMRDDPRRSDARASAVQG